MYNLVNFLAENTSLLQPCTSLLQPCTRPPTWKFAISHCTSLRFMCGRDFAAAKFKSYCGGAKLSLSGISQERTTKGVLTDEVSVLLASYL